MDKSVRFELTGTELHTLLHLLSKLENDRTECEIGSYINTYARLLWCGSDPERSSMINKVAAAYLSSWGNGFAN